MEGLPVKIIYSNAPGLYMMVINGSCHNTVFIFLDIQIKDNSKIQPGNMGHGL